MRFLFTVFSIYILFNLTAQAPSNEIHVLYKNEIVTFGQNDLKYVKNVEILKAIIKNWLDISEDITLRRGENEALGSKTPIDGLFNTRENALHVVVEGKIELEYLSVCL